MGESPEPVANHVLAALAHESIAAGFVLAVQLEADAEGEQDERVRDLYRRMARYIEANSLLGEHVLNRQSTAQMALGFVVESVNTILRRLAKIESDDDDGPRLKSIGNAVFRWRPFERFFDTVRLKSEANDWKSRCRAAHDALMIVESRLTVMHKWEREAVDASGGAVPDSGRLEALAMALHEVGRARADCEISEEQ